MPPRRDLEGRRGLTAKSHSSRGSPTGRWDSLRPESPDATVGVDHGRTHVGVAEQFLHVQISEPLSRRCVANECRNVWHPTRFVLPAGLAASATARCTRARCVRRSSRIESGSITCRSFCPSRGER